MTEGRDYLAYCPWCDAPVQHAAPDGVELCAEHGVLEGVSDAEWLSVLRERGMLGDLEDAPEGGDDD